MFGEETTRDFVFEEAVAVMLRKGVEEVQLVEERPGLTLS